MGNIDRRAGQLSGAIAWLLIATVVVQFYTAGLGLFGGASFGAHRIIGSLSVLISLLLLVFVLVARRGRAAGFLALGCVLLTSLQPVLIFVMRVRAPVLAAAHPVVGLLIGILAWMIATRGAGISWGRTSDRSPPSRPVVALE